MLIERRQQRSYVSYSQFYVEDADQPGDTGDASFWTQQASDDKIAVIAGTIGFGTGTYGTVRIYSELHDAEPSLDLTMWDHVTEAGLEVRSGLVRVVGCIDNILGELFTVQPGPYRVRCCHANLAGAKGFGNGEDWYVVQFWPAPISPPVVLKRWAGYGMLRW
jgi:hypothetical protein